MAASRRSDSKQRSVAKTEEEDERRRRRRTKGDRASIVVRDACVWGQLLCVGRRENEVRKGRGEGGRRTERASRIRLRVSTVGSRVGLSTTRLLTQLCCEAAQSRACSPSLSSAPDTSTKQGTTQSPLWRDPIRTPRCRPSHDAPGRGNVDLVLDSLVNAYNIARTECSSTGQHPSARPLGLVKLSDHRGGGCACRRTCRRDRLAARRISCSALQYTVSNILESACVLTVQTQREPSVRRSAPSTST